MHTAPPHRLEPCGIGIGDMLYPVFDRPRVYLSFRDGFVQVELGRGARSRPPVRLRNRVG